MVEEKSNEINQKGTLRVLPTTSSRAGFFEGISNFGARTPFFGVMDREHKSEEDAKKKFARTKTAPTNVPVQTDVHTSLRPCSHSSLTRERRNVVREPTHWTQRIRRRRTPDTTPAKILIARSIAVIKAKERVRRGPSLSNPSCLKSLWYTFFAVFGARWMDSQHFRLRLCSSNSIV